MDLPFATSVMFGVGVAPKKKLSCLFNQPNFHSEIRLAPGNVVMITLLYMERDPCGSGYTGLRERIQF